MKGKIMKARMYIIIIACLATMNAFADMTQSNKSFGQSDYDEMTSSRAVMNSPRYSSPIYEPFSNTTPSEQTDLGYGSPRKGGLRKTQSDDDPWGENQDPGEKDPDSPIGDALFPLLAMALVFGGIILLRRRKVKG